MALNTFTPTDPPTKGIASISTINISTLITKLADSYFTDISQFKRIVVYYKHDRQHRKIVHYNTGSSFQANITWSTSADTGVWEKYQICAYDTEDSVATLDRAAIGDLEDITIS